MVPYVTSKLLNEKGVKHGFFTREGGVSLGEFSSLNCRISSLDDNNNVEKNCTRVAASLGFSNESLFRLNQVHSDLVFEASFDDISPKGDAFITNDPQKLISVQTADCTPILLYAEDINFVACVHAGWKGAFCGVIQSTLYKLFDKGADAHRIIAAIGPCIQQKSYEVDQQFYDKFLEQDVDNKQFFEDMHFNLPEYCKKQFILLGVKCIDDLKLDTYSDEKRFFSYRRFTQKNSRGSTYGKFGCQLSAISNYKERR